MEPLTGLPRGRTENGKEPAVSDASEKNANTCQSRATDFFKAALREQVTRELCRITKSDCAKPAAAKFFGSIGELVAQRFTPNFEEIREIPGEVQEWREIPGIQLNPPAAKITKPVVDGTK